MTLAITPSQELSAGIPPLADPEYPLIVTGPPLEQPTTATNETTIEIPSQPEDDVAKRIAQDIITGYAHRMAATRFARCGRSNNALRVASRGSIAVAYASANQAMRKAGWGSEST